MPVAEKVFVEGKLECDQRYVGEKRTTVQIIAVEGLTTKVKPET
jgi:hypothetical protein